RRDEAKGEPKIRDIDGEGTPERGHGAHGEDDRLEDGDREDAADRLDERIAGRELDLAAASLAAKQEVAEERDIVPGANGLAAGGAVGGRADHAHLARDAVDDDVEEAAPDEPKGRGE